MLITHKHSEKNAAEKGERGFALDLYLAFAVPPLQAECERHLQALLATLQQPRLELYRPVDQPSAPIPALRLTGELREQGSAGQEAYKQALLALLFGPAKSIEVGQRGFLRSREGYTEWMPWRCNKVVQIEDLTATKALPFEQGVKYILERRSTNHPNRPQVS